MKITTRRLTAVTVAATTGIALVACSSDDTETATPAADTAVEQPATEAAGQPDGDPVDDLNLLAAGETLTSTGAQSGDEEYTLTFDNARQDGSNTCIDGIFDIVTPTRDAFFDDGLSEEEVQQNEGLAGIPIDMAKLHTVTGDAVSTDDVETTMDRTSELTDPTQTFQVCFDAGGADAVVVETTMYGDLAPTNVDGWRIDL
ncbi:MAG: hypothetical protein ACI38U_07755 [Corynebacterium sp.]|uniref:hypothetical protein n=1 Tax=Corynebacterium sp. TaxID=1720 RepID=UPI003F0F8B6B